MNFNQQEIRLMDVYLGNLGDTVEYPFKDDTYDIEPWITVESQYPTRNVVAHGNFTIPDNVIDRVTGYNVIHNTGLEAHSTGVQYVRP